MKRLTIFAISLVFFVFVSFAFAKKIAKSPEKEQGDTFATLDDALKSGKPVFCLFYTTKACACTNRKCKEALTMCDSLAKSFPEGIVYFALNAGNDNSIAKQYKIVAFPVAIFFDEKGNEVARLQSWEIKGDVIKNKLAEITNKEKK